MTTPALIGICLGSALFLVTLAAVTCFCYRRRTTNGSTQKLTSVIKKNSHHHHHHHSEKPLVLRKPSAVKSPSSGSVGGPVLMKKSPSPTLGKIPNTRTSPTGQRSPTDKGGIVGMVTSSSNHSSRQNSPNVEDKSYIESENEKLRNGNKKEEMEENKEKEVLVEKLCKLGQLYFR